jgi:hypothetical protein
MAAQTTNQLPMDAEVVDFQNDRTDPNNPQNQSGEAIEDNDESEEAIEEEDLDDEPLDEDGDPTGEHGHQQDDNYALGGHVTRSGGI